MNNNLIYAIAAEERVREMKAIGEEIESFDPTEYGFSSYDDYENERVKFNLKKVNVELCPEHYQGADELIYNALVNKHYSLWISKFYKTSVWHGNDELDYDLCEELDLPIYEMGYRGGSFIGGPNDLLVALVIPESTGATSTILQNWLLKLMKSKGLNAIIAGNDILVDGVKVIGAIERKYEDTLLFGWSFSLTDHRELIAKICKKQSKKKPGYLSPDQITREDFINEVKSWVC